MFMAETTKNVKELVNSIDKLEKEQIKNKFEGWEKYFDLYNSSYTIFMTKKSDYIKSLDEFDKEIEPIIKFFGELSPFETYVSRLNNNIETTENLLSSTDISVKNCDKITSELIEQAKNYLKINYEKIQQEIPPQYISKKIFKKNKSLTSAEVANDLYSCKVKFLDKEKQQIEKKLTRAINNIKILKKDISTKLGILKYRSISRNVLQVSESSPLKILKELYDALTNGTDLPLYKNKDLLEMPKKLDVKVENSMKKVIDCKWEKLNELKTMLDFYNNLKAKLAGLDKNAENEAGVTSRYFKDLKGKNSTKDILDISTEVKKEIREFKFTVETNESIQLYVKVLSLKEQSKIILSCIAALEDLLEDLSKKKIDDIMEYFVHEKVDKVKVFEIVYQMFKILLELIPLLGPAISKTSDAVEKVREVTKDVAEGVGHAASAGEGIKDCYLGIKEAKNRENNE